MAQFDEDMRKKIAAALTNPTPAPPPRLDESTDYGKMLAIFSVFDPQRVEKTQETVELGFGQRPVARLSLAGRLTSGAVHGCVMGQQRSYRTLWCFRRLPSCAWPVVRYRHRSLWD